ncbi:hypothetical protein SAMN04487911_11548 [Arenibacter nanhaiticus]|uniref:Uncharacterized protein n=1 Tax=Arenibacter nanhaiticus TaxID=558155 RepID=A0A1M6HW36_9FLAO|nr:hypothetical protein SAMN04487911_11548 [Arenibacter nanhaiticus]
MPFKNYTLKKNLKTEKWEKAIKNRKEARLLIKPMEQGENES